MTTARLTGVTRRFGDTVAVDGVDLEIRGGLVTGLLGPNGAGKSTVINLLVGLRFPDQGRVELFGGDPRNAANRRLLGVTPQETGLPAALRVREVLDFAARHFPDPLPAGPLLERFGLTRLTRRQVGGLSGGERRRLAVVLALVGRPQLVVLDEPTTGLDVGARRTVWDAISEFHLTGGTVLLSSHHLEEVEQLAHRVVVMGRGRVLADGETADVRGMAANGRVSFRGPQPPALPGVTREEREGDRHVLYTADADRLVRELVAADHRFADLRLAPASLEEAFMNILARPERLPADAATVRGMP